MEVINAYCIFKDGRFTTTAWFKMGQSLKIHYDLRGYVAESRAAETAETVTLYEDRADHSILNEEPYSLKSTKPPIVLLSDEAKQIGPLGSQPDNGWQANMLSAVRIAIRV